MKGFTAEISGTAFNYYDSSRLVIFRDEKGVQGGTVPIEKIKHILFGCTAQVGASTYWSEIATVGTLDNLLNGGKINFVQYLERLPEGYISKKKELLEEVKKEMPAQNKIVYDGESLS